MATMLSLIQQATGELGLSVPTYVAGNTAQDAIQQLALLNAVGQELQREYDWQALETEYRFTTQFLNTTGTVTQGSAVVTNIPDTTGLDTTYMAGGAGAGVPNDTYIVSVDGSTQVTLSQVATLSGSVSIGFGKTKYSFPSDYDRQVDRTHFDKSKRWEMTGPQTPQQWEWLKSSYISTGPRIRFRLMGNKFQIWPMVTTAEYLGFNYISKNWGASAAGAGKSLLTADDDTCIFPDRLMVLGLKLKYFDVKGFDTTTFERAFESQKSIAKANDSGAKTLSMAPRMSDVLITSDQIPDTGYGQ